MPKVIRVANFGKGKGGLSTVGYSVYNISGSLSGSRVTSGVNEVGTSTGVYMANVEFTSDFSGLIVWDTGGDSPSYATEEYNHVSEDITFLRDVTAGKWEINESTKQMIFYKEDNETEVAKYNLLDGDDAPSVTSVFQRVKV